MDIILLVFTKGENSMRWEAVALVMCQLCEFFAGVPDKDMIMVFAPLLRENEEGRWNPVNKGLMPATQNETLQS